MLVQLLALFITFGILVFWWAMNELLVDLARRGDELGLAFVISFLTFVTGISGCGVIVMILA